jgi:hypothetical protein
MYRKHNIKYKYINALYCSFQACIICTCTSKKWRCDVSQFTDDSCTVREYRVPKVNYRLNIPVVLAEQAAFPNLYGNITVLWSISGFFINLMGLLCSLWLGLSCVKNPRRFNPPPPPPTFPLALGLSQMKSKVRNIDLTIYTHFINKM